MQWGKFSGFYVSLFGRIGESNVNRGGRGPFGTMSVERREGRRRRRKDKDKDKGMAAIDPMHLEERG